MAKQALGIAALVAAVTATGCESVPDIRFVDDDAGSSGAPADGSASDAHDADAPETSTLACTAPPPEEDAVCCGAVWCVGNCEQRNCDACATAGCAPSELCCGRPQNVQCKSKCP